MQVIHGPFLRLLCGAFEKPTQQCDAIWWALVLTVRVRMVMVRDTTLLQHKCPSVTLLEYFMPNRSMTTNLFLELSFCLPIRLPNPSHMLSQPLLTITNAPADPIRVVVVDGTRQLGCMRPWKPLCRLRPRTRMTSLHWRFLA